MNDEELKSKMLEEAGVGTHGASFNRLPSTASTENIREAIKRIRAILRT